jgi:5-methylcytosine-specific restriction endonuclease McrA
LKRGKIKVAYCVSNCVKGLWMQTLVVDAGFQPVNMISGFEALVMVISEKADIVSTYDKIVRSVSLTFHLPKIIKLKRIVKTIRKNAQIAYSKYNVHLRDNFTCQYCSKVLNQKTATVDHVTPKSRGGKNTWENTVTSCGTCNNKKDSKTPKEANMVLLRTPQKPKIISMIKQELQEVMNEMIKDIY